MEKVLFNEQMAAQIIERFNLSPTTLKVWRTRGTIPKQYFDPNFDQSARLKDFDTEYQKFKVIMQDKRIATTKFRSLGKKAADVWRGKDRMTEKESIGLKTEISEIRTALSMAIKVTNLSSILALTKDGRLHPTLIFGQTLYYRIKQVQTDGTFLSKDEKGKIRLELMSLYNFLKI